MRTFKIAIAIDGKITLPDTILKDLRLLAAEEPADGGPDYLHRLHKEFYEDDDAFLQKALKHALRNIVRAGVVNDLGGLGEGVGVRCAPATVEVSVPEKVITKVKARTQLTYGGELPSDGPDFCDGPTSNGFAKGTPYNRAEQEHSAALAGDINPYPRFGEEGALEQADA